MPRTLMATKASSKNNTAKTLITVKVLFALILSCFPLFEVKGQNYPTVYWSPSTVNVTFQQGSTQPVKGSVFAPPAPPSGDVQSKIVSFYSTIALKDSTLVIDPNIAPFLRNAYPQPGSLAAWQRKNIFLFFSIPAGARIGTYEGTVQIRNAGTLLLGALTVKIAVEANNSPDPNEKESGSPAHVALNGASENAFNSQNNPVIFDITGETLTNDPENVRVFRNNLFVPQSSIQFTPNTITLSSVLVEGKNDLILLAHDSQGETIYAEFTLWAGSRTLTVNILDENGQLGNGVDVKAQLGDDDEVNATGKSVNGQIKFFNLPDRTIIINAFGSGNRIASTATTGGAGSVQLKLSAIGQPSNIQNNDISLGTAGWNIGTAPVQVIPHNEGTNLLHSAFIENVPPKSSARKVSAYSRQLRAAEYKNLLTQSLTLANNNDMDLQLSTLGEGPQTISRTFNTTPGVSSIKVRYRFITSEIPGGYFGTQYNDSFNVSIRNQAGGSQSESQSMNGLGLAAFDASGATAWREASLPVKKEGDTVQVDLTVANVADGAFDSQLVVDFIQERKLAITKLNLLDHDRTSLNYLSAAPHSYFSGHTLVGGDVTIEGAADDDLQSLKLEVIQNGKVVATGNLSPFLPDLPIAFGNSGKVEFSAFETFEIPTSQLANISGVSDGTLSLRVKATSGDGEEVSRDFGAVNLLVRYTNNNRYGGRDEIRGGDDWARPSLKTLAEGYSGMLWGDFSNMNAGDFEPDHGSHQKGVDADGWFDGYNARNAATAQKIIQQLNSPLGSNILMVGVTFEQISTSTFWNAIKDINLADGRKAKNVIFPWKKHEGHFHWRMK